jgi:hypothetical protein
MNIVKLPLTAVTLSNRAVKALAISNWLQRDCGLAVGKDFDWFFMSKENEVHFKFHEEHNESMESVLLMRWL